MYQHLHTDENQEHANARLQVSELIGNGCQQEEHGAQTEDGEDIGEEYHVWVE